ncbi:MAG TPA: alginate lyase family protein [Patescibacteria group bacterium]|nr:alginate lyase family protein [Patescibacteria group bacterium]
MRAGRLVGMSASEIAERGRQETRKLLDRWGGPSSARPGAVAAGAARPGEDRLLAEFRETAGRSFFAGAVDARTPGLLSERMPAARDRAIADADALCAGRFALLGYRDLRFGDPIDWRLDPTSGRRSSLVHWSRLDPLDPKAVGDAKVVWELNRHQWMVTLARAHRLTGEERFGRAVARHLAAWIEANPPEQGINWSSSLEVALRIVSWSWAAALLAESDVLEGGLFPILCDAVAQHATHVERYLSRYFSPNTHLTGEALGLFYAGVLFPEQAGASRWKALGRDILEEEIARQVLPDGVHFEQSTAYLRYTLEIYLHYLILSGRDHAPVGTPVVTGVGALLDFLVAIRRPDGRIPAIGDADGGFLLPLHAREPGDARGLLGTAAALLGRPDCAWAAGEAAPETLWLLGERGLEDFAALRPGPPRAPESRLFPSGGYAVMRHGWDARGHQLVFDVGPLGCPHSAGHGHADLLSIQCAAFGLTFLEDAGTYCYTPDRRWRNFFRGSRAHSALTVDGRVQADPAGPFAWKERPSARLRRWSSTDRFDYADAEHDAFALRSDRVIHRRRVLFVKPDYWLIADDVLGEEEHTVEVRFQFAPMVVTVEADGAARAFGFGRRLLDVRPFATAPLTAKIREGEVDPMEGWVSPDYGVRRPAPALVYSLRARLPIRLLTLLVPSDNPFRPPRPVAALDGDASGPEGVVFLDTGAIARFEGDTAIVEGR